MSYDTTQALAGIGALIKKLVVPSASALANRATAAAFQRVLEPLESNADPNNPGLVEIFQQINANIAALKEAGANDTASLLQLKRWTHDAYTCYEALQYLLRLSNGMGFRGPAHQFYETIVPEAFQFGKVSPIAVPGGPGPISPQPTPSPTTSPSPGGPTPTPAPSGGTPVGGPVPVPAPALPQMWLSAELTGIPGSGEPYNGVSLQSLLGLNSVFVPLFARTTNATSTDCYWLDDINDPTIIGGTTDLWTATYNATNLAVILSLSLDCADGTPRANFRPTDTVAFLNSLNVLAFQIAQAANRVGADAVCIAPGFFPYSGNGDYPALYMPQWTTIVSTIRSVFSGEILYLASPANAGPIGGPNAMDWSIWGAVGVAIQPPFGPATTAAAIQSYWETTIDKEGSAGYNTPAWGVNSWIRKLYDQWKTAGKKIWLYTGVR